jgi:hypothetical protein
MKRENGSIRKELSQRHQGTKHTEEEGVRGFGIMVPGTVGVE